jgi:hypothetical protein
MKTLLLLIALIAAQVSRADTTNLVEILPFVVKSSQALEIEGFPQPLTTNNVSEFRVIRGGGLVLARVIVRDRWQFGFNAKGNYISNFTDRKHSISIAYKAEDLIPLLPPESTNTVYNCLTKLEAAEFAAKYLKRLGFDPSLALSPVAKQWKWDPKQGGRTGLLPIFMVDFPRKEDPESALFFVEVDGLHKRINHFSTM